MIMTEHLNLEVLQPTKRNPQLGDIFVLKPSRRAFYFGRVMLFDTALARGYPVVYVYNATARKPEPIPALHRDALLIAPQAVNFLPWRRGYFQTIANRPIGPSDLLQTHCFYDPVSQTYKDESGRELANSVEPCGTFGIGSYRTIDDAISTALGLPLAPD
jgi:hypothetical protein